MSPRVVAVVVTWNRSTLIERILRAIDAQDRRPDVVVVVDNASTDDTPDLLVRLGSELAVPLSVRRLGTNTGGAGGFAEGIGAALDLGADLLWLMDDDGAPPPDSLAALLPWAGRYDFVGPAVVAEHDESRLCFPIRLPGTARVVHTLPDLERAAVGGVLEEVVIPFNGVLLTRALVERIGVPRADFFIWGDDVEYLWRARRAGARVATVVGSRFRHPATDDLGTPMMLGRTTYNHTPSDLKHYCMVRNNVTNLREYVGALGVVAFLVKTVWFYLFTRPRPARLRLSGQAVAAALRGDFTGHRRFLQPEVPVDRTDRTDERAGPETVAVVVVTYNRADLLARCLDGLAASTRRPDAVIVVDNASTDHTPDVLGGRDDLPLQVVRSEENLGGAGGFCLGVRTAYEAGFERIWLIDDDVVPAPSCLGVLMSHAGPALIAVREDRQGRLCEKAATDFDLRNPLAVRPKRATVESTYGTRAAMPAEVVVENVAFEGFLVHRRVVAAVGLPDPGFFIFYDDVDFAVRARRAGFTIRALRDAVLVRQLDFDQQHDTGSWKGYYMYRNLFVVHLRHGENALVRRKPWLIALGVVVLAGLRGRRDEARNAARAVRDAPALARTAPPPAQPPLMTGRAAPHDRSSRPPRRAARRFEGMIAGIGSESGTRVVVGHWPTSPMGSFSDVMVETASGHRVLLAPSEEVAAFVAGTYVFDEVRVEPVRVVVDGPRWSVTSPSLALRLTTGRSTAIGSLLRLVPPPLATSPAWCTLTDPVARVALRGVRTRGTAREGRREYYGATGTREVLSAAGTFDGAALGALRPVDPPCRFGFSSTPRRPSVTSVVTTVLDRRSPGRGRVLSRRPAHRQPLG